MSWGGGRQGGREGRGDTHLAVDWLNLLQGGQHEDRRLAHPGLGLAQDVHAQDGLGDALMLHCRGKRS